MAGSDATEPVWSSFRGYGVLPLPHPKDAEVAQLLAAHPHGGDENLGIVLAAYAERMAALAVREGAIERVREGLRAAVVAVRTLDDPRDALPALNLLYDAAGRVGADAEAVFLDAAATELAPWSDVMRDFLACDEANRAVEVVGYAVATDDEGFLYRRTW